MLNATFPKLIILPTSGKMEEFGSTGGRKEEEDYFEGLGIVARITVAYMLKRQGLRLDLINLAT
jgi:hypothetical protein